LASFRKGRVNDCGIPLFHAYQQNCLIAKTMKAWVLGGPEELALVEKPVPEPGLAEVLVRIDAVAICATDLEIIKHGLPASIEGRERPVRRGLAAARRRHEADRRAVTSLFSNIGAEFSRCPGEKVGIVRLWRPR
jgi:hypothetical protein